MNINLLEKLYSRLCSTFGRQCRKFTFNIYERTKLKTRKFSILSQNCVGSIWYHDLGLEFTSPTINMKFNGNDWVDFLDDFDNAVNMPIVEVKSNNPFPAGLIGGKYYVDFVHYKTIEQVREKWELRKQRLLPKKVVLAFDEGMDDAHILKFINLSQFPNRLLFICQSRYQRLNCSNNPHIIPIDDKWGGAKLLNFCSLTGKRAYYIYIDYIDYLNNLR